MRSNNKGIAAAIGLLALGGCVGGGGYDDAPRIDPPLGAASDQRAPQGYDGAGADYTPPQTADRGNRNAPPAYRDEQQAPAYQPPQPPPADMPQGDGPRGTSGEARYDQVGYAGAGAGSGGISAASRALPRGAYAEITSLDTGRTILVLIADNMAPGNRIVDLSRGAAQLLGVGEGAAVRIRRVDPPAPDQAALASGQPASQRMDTPPALLTGLRKKLGMASAPVAAPGRYRPPPAAASPPRNAPEAGYARPGAAALPPAGVAVRDTAAAPSGFFVQVAALSSRDRAVALAGSLGGGSVVQAGNVWRVRVGPYRDAGAAQHARDALAARGYGGAQVVRDR